MELKYQFAALNPKLHFSSNRTFMELKSNKLEAASWKELGSNRTFMELKCRCRCRSRQASACSNRTFMELKFWLPMLHNCWPRVLIVPLWN